LQNLLLSTIDDKKNGILPSEFLRLQDHILDTSKRPLEHLLMETGEGGKQNVLAHTVICLKKKKKKKVFSNKLFSSIPAPYVGIVALQ